MLGLFASASNETHYLQFDQYAQNVKDIIVKSQTIADERRHTLTQPLHLFAAALQNESVIKACQNLKLPREKMTEQVETALSDMPLHAKEEEQAYLSPICEKLFTSLERDSSKNDLVPLEKFFQALCSKSYKPNSTIFQAVGGDLEAFCKELQAVRKAGFSQMSIASLLKMEEGMGKRVIGQKEAIHAVSRVVRRGKVGLNDPGRPLGVMMFLGPSGVGKTEVAKALTEFLYGDEKLMVRLDMSEYSEKHMAQRLIGSPPGYQDSQNGGYLTEAVRKNPNAIVLMDEIEKSNSDVFDMFLQICDDGRLTDGVGRTADFSNTIIIMTSNIGGRKIANAGKELMTPDGQLAMKEMLHAEMMSSGKFKPEFLNRIDDIICFQSLSQLEIGQIVDIQLRSIEKRLKPKDISITFDQAAKNAVAEMGYDPLMGGRPIKRILTKYVIDKLAERILDGTYRAGSHIQVSYDNDKFIFG
jgi:ATP-dependent Clp protease ATP-binding subunit ClpA